MEDYHLIKNAEVHEAISFVLEHTPPALELVISTRVEPPLPIARLRAGARSWRSPQRISASR